jgi:hypothetical protein
MERQASDDTKGVDQIGGMEVDSTPTNVAELYMLPGGFTKNNQPVRDKPDGVPAKANVSPGLRGLDDC